MSKDYPESLTPAGGVAPAPRRIRAVVAGEVVVDSSAAHYVWEVEPYPQYYIPLKDVRPDLLEDEGHRQQGRFGTYQQHGLRMGDLHRAKAARVLADSPVEELRGSVRFEWSAMDAWFEEDEQVFVHPRNPYVRVDALRSTREVEVTLEGVVLAHSRAPVLVFETGLPPRYYLDRTQIDFTHLEHSDTVTACPYKGKTSGYWSARIDGSEHTDIAWSYDFPTLALGPIAGLVAFYSERVDVSVDGVKLPRSRAE